MIDAAAGRQALRPHALLTPRPTSVIDRSGGGRAAALLPPIAAACPTSVRSIDACMYAHRRARVAAGEWTLRRRRPDPASPDLGDRSMLPTSLSTTLDLGHRSEGRRPCRRLTPADRRLVPDVLRSSLEIGSVQGSPRNRPSERGGRRMLISPSPKFGSLLRGLHDPAGSSSSTTERGK